MTTPRRTTSARARDDRPVSEDGPDVLLDVELKDGSLWLVLVNASDRAAFDVSVTFREPLMGVGGERDISALRVFRALPLLRPRHELRVFVDVARELYARRQPTRIEAEVAWHSRGGARSSHRFRHDLAIWEDFGEVGGTADQGA